MEWDVPDTTKNRAPFGSSGGDQAAFPKILVVTVTECGSHAPVLAAMGGGQGQRGAVPGPAVVPAAGTGLAADRGRNFYNWKDWCAAGGTGAALLWRVMANARLPALEMLTGGSYVSVLIDPKITGARRDALIAAARRGGTWMRTSRASPLKLWV